MLWLSGPGGGGVAGQGWGGVEDLQRTEIFGSTSLSLTQPGLQVLVLRWEEVGDAVSRGQARRRGSGSTECPATPLPWPPAAGQRRVPERQHHGGRRQPMCDPKGCAAVLGAVGWVGGDPSPPPLG